MKAHLPNPNLKTPLSDVLIKIHFPANSISLHLLFQSLLLQVTHPTRARRVGGEVQVLNHWSVRTSFHFESSWATGYLFSLSGLAKSCIRWPTSAALQICPTRSIDHSRFCVSVKFTVRTMLPYFFLELLFSYLIGLLFSYNNAIYLYRHDLEVNGGKGLIVDPRTKYIYHRPAAWYLWFL